MGGEEGQLQNYPRLQQTYYKIRTSQLSGSDDSGLQGCYVLLAGMYLQFSAQGMITPGGGRGRVWRSEEDYWL